MKKTGGPDFSQRLVRLMLERKMTIRTAATHAQVATSTVQNWRSGHVPTDFCAVKRLAEALDVSLSFLLTGNEDRISRTGKPSITECFNVGGVVFNGYARITIQELLPHNETLPKNTK